jgi:ectoine hydroxylase-related dioxygenase (phytanoyl-CoA dioxygenase family)
MMDTEKYKEEILQKGFTTIDTVYSTEEIDKIITVINLADKSKETFRISTELFAIRQFFKEIPSVTELVFNEKLKAILKQVFGNGFFVVKSIYFDKPEKSNWYVSYHQDLTISVDQKIDVPNFGPWTVKHNQFGVQPPIEMLEKNFTTRIHLDDTDENNGALKVLPESHLQKIYRPETIDWAKETETTCPVKKGGLMIMKPLLLHSSSRTTNNKKRRVIHVEFSNQELPIGMNWSERWDFQ